MRGDVCFAVEKVDDVLALVLAPIIGNMYAPADQHRGPFHGHWSLPRCYRVGTESGDKIPPQALAKDVGLLVCAEHGAAVVVDLLVNRLPLLLGCA